MTGKVTKVDDKDKSFTIITKGEEVSQS